MKKVFPSKNPALQSRFELMFDICKDITELVSGVKYDLKKNSIVVKIRETVDLDAIRLLRGIFDEELEILLRFFCPQNITTGELIFYNCEISGHSTEMSYGSGQCVVHEIEVTFSNYELMVPSADIE